MLQCTFFGIIINRPSQTNPHWVFLGILTNDKPSAIFKLGGNKTKSQDISMDDNLAFQPTTGFVAQLGISIEPLEEVMRQQQVFNQSKSTALVKVVDNQQDYGLKLIESTWANRFL